MNSLPLRWTEETLYTSGDEYFRGLLRAVEQASLSIELETYIFEKGVLADRLVKRLIDASARGVRVRLIVDGWGSPRFIEDYWSVLRRAKVRVHFFRAIPWLLKRLPGDPDSFILRFFLRWKRLNRGNHRKFCLIDSRELWVGSFNISDVHLREVQGDNVWKDLGVRVTGADLKSARRAFQRAYRGWAALNWPSRSPKLLLLNDSYIHKRRTRLAHVQRIRDAQERIWIATPYFVPLGMIYRQLIRKAKSGIDVRLMVPAKNDVWIMKWISAPLLRNLFHRGVKVFVYEPRFMHQKVLIADDWMCLGSTNFNHRSFLHDLEMDVVITHDDNKIAILNNYVQDQRLSEPFDSSAWGHLPLWQQWLSSLFLILRYWS
jgi:cardiolipin synthase